MSVIFQGQYDAYTKEFWLNGIMKPAPDRSIREIGETIKAERLVRIQIPFTSLGAVMEVEFIIISEDNPSLLSMRYRYKNGTDLSIKGIYIFP